MSKVTHRFRFLFSTLMLWALTPYANAQASAVCYPRLAGLTGWWTGNGSPNDVIGGRDALLHDNARIGSGLVEQAIALVGDGDFVEVPHDPALNEGGS